MIRELLSNLKSARIFLALGLVPLMVSVSAADSSDSVTIHTPYNPATGIWIQQVGDLYPSASTQQSVYYTRYSQQLSAKALDYYYDGNGYLKLSNKRVLCRTKGADGIIHHPDGDLVVAGQETNTLFKVKSDGADTNNCVTKSEWVGSGATYHLMMSPNDSVLFSAGIPGDLYSLRTNSSANGRLEKIRRINITGSTNNITTVVWDNDGNMFYTRSSNLGTISGNSQNNAQFGIIEKVNCQGISGTVAPQKCSADKITTVYTKTLIDSLKGAHGASFDEYSNTILLFGDSHIVQIDPSTHKIVADVDLRKYLFNDDKMTGSFSNNTAETWGYAISNSNEIRWLLDQGTADGKGHLFVASNSGHLVFIDYTSNPYKLINNNILLHVQWIDNYLDDIAPIAGAGSNRTSASTTPGLVVSSSSRSSSSANIFRESSSSKNSSSSIGGGGSRSSSSVGKSSSSQGSGSGDGSSSSGVTGKSSSSIGSGDGSSSSKGGSSGGGEEGSSDSSTGKSSGSGEGDSSSSGTTGGGEGGDGSSSSGTTGGGEEGGDGSSSSGSTGGGDEWTPPWISDSTKYEGFDDDGSGGQDGRDLYPTNDKRDKGDTLVTEGSKLIPIPSDSSTTGVIVINGNKYVTGEGSKSTPLTGFGSDSTTAADRESVAVGDVIKITLDADKIKDYFGDSDSLYISGADGFLFVDPNNPNPGTPSANISIGVTGKDQSFWVTADTVTSGAIYITDKDGHLIIFDGISFYDPIPKAELGYIQDSDDDGKLDSLEIILSDTIPQGLTPTGIAVVVNGDTIQLTSAITVSGSRIYADASDKDLSKDSFPEDARVIITYSSEATGTSYQRDASLLQLGSHVIKQAYAIRNKNGRDSLFIEFNIDIIPADLTNPEMVAWLNGQGFDLDEVNVYLPTKNMIILVGDSLGLNGSSDYVTLAPGATFNNLSFIASAEYERQVPVTVQNRYPSAETVEYYDTDGDGALDSIAVRFSSKVTADDLKNFYFSFPWYSSRGLLIELQAQPQNLILSDDGLSVGWIVTSNFNVASGLTEIKSEVPQATLYTYYDIFGNSFVVPQKISLVDKMAPVIAAASLHYGDSRDTLTVTFSETVNYSDLVGKDFFAYIHGKDTIDINPSRMIWSADGKTVRLVLRESTDGIVPGDSLLVVPGAKSKISDIYGNESLENASPVVIGGLLGKLVESVKMGYYDPEKYVLNTLNSVSISYVPNQTRTSDLRDEGTLGHLISLGERFVPQLVDGAKLDADGNYDASVLDSINPADVFVNFSVSYFDNLGQYVTDTTFNIPCNSPAFGTSQNCLTTDKKVFVNWNYKDHTGRLVGSGVYIVEFKLIVRYKQKKIQEEMRDKWGVRRKKSK